jgi:hypothetical protein
MSLLINGSKTVTIAGTQLQCVEVYTGESYTLPFTFTDTGGTPINITGWTFATTVKWYNTVVTYPATQTTVEDIVLSNTVLVSPQPTPNPPTGMTAAIVSGSAGTGYLYVPSTINGGLSVALDSTTSLMAIINLTVTRTNSYSKTDVNIEPIGMIIRYI